ncbi:MAG TPA: GMC family oxidoreductase, partial [Gemmatimonadaceae bacterium]|nr:GMC family oxidoreductase [Gemmatimonadaceae bacterium]
PNKSSGVIFERAAKQLGWHPEPAPLAITSQPHNGRPACQHCGYCMGFGCEYGAKSSTLATVIPIAEKTGKCEVRANSYVRKIATDAKGRVTGVVYFDADRREQRQAARAVVLCANGAETPRLLLNSKTNQFPQGLANSSGLVGKYLMFNGAALAQGIFEHPLNEYKSTNVRRYALDWYDSDPKRGFYGGGGIDARFDGKLPVIFALSTPPHHPNWGPIFKRFLQHGFTRQLALYGHSTSLPVESNNITLDPMVKDDFGVPALRVTYSDHPDDLKMSEFLLARCKEVFEVAKARQYWGAPVAPQTFSAHLLGTCRMGDDAAKSVIDKFHRAHDVPNLFICDGSSLVTSGRGQPTMTIMALAFRAGEKIAEFAKRGEI